MYNVTIVQRRLTNYRLPFFEALRTRLLNHDINLQLLHGEAKETELSKGDGGRLDWADHLPTKYPFNQRLCWQPHWSKSKGADLVILTQENWLIANHISLLMPRRHLLAFWGHGANFQSSGRRLVDRYKDWTTLRVDWWFAYTAQSKSRILAAGFDEKKITCVNNSLDLAEMKDDLLNEARMPREVKLRRHELRDGPIGIFIGSLYKEKRLDFLIRSCYIVRETFPDFQLVVVGSGPDEEWVKKIANNAPWIRFMGRKDGREKASLLTVSSVVLNPGLVGLGIFDGLCSGLPYLTTDCRLHSPEIAYLEDGVGAMSKDNEKDYAHLIVSALTNQALRATASKKGPETADKFSLGRMVDNFASGVVRCLSEKS